MIGLLSQDSTARADRVVGLVIVAGVLGAPFYRTEVVRAELLGDSTLRPDATIALLCAALALAWRSLARRNHIRADPAALTWADFDGSRPGALRRGLLLGWAGRCALVAYFAVVAGLLLRTPIETLPVGFTLFAAVSALMLAAARRRPGRGGRAAEQGAAIALAGVGGLALVADLGHAPLWTVSALAVVVLLGLAVVPGVPLATDAGRGELVAGHAARMVRRVSITFLDPWALLPPGAPVRPAGVLAGRLVLARYVLTGVLGRRTSMPLVVLLAATVAAVHQVFPGIDAIWLVGIGGYLATLPLAGSLGELHRSPGLRRWLGRSDRSLKVTTIAVLGALMAGWLGLVLLLGVPLSGGAALALLVSVVAVVRTVSRGGLDYGNLGTVVFEGILIPAGLLLQLAHGPDLLLICLLLLVGLATSLAAPIVLGISAAAVVH